MKTKFVFIYAAAVTLGMLSFLAAQTPAPTPAQKAPTQKTGGRGRGPATPTGPTPRLPDGTPDLAGVWMGGGSNSGDITKGLKPGEEVVMLPSAEKIMKGRKSQDDPQANCMPFGVPRGAPYPWRIVQTPTHTAATHIFILYEGNIHSFRQIFMNAKHPDDPDPTWYGHSIGTWDKDTLVVDTVGFNDKFWFDYLGHPHTQQLHTVERYTRNDLGNMTIEVTINDPGAYAKPFTTTGKARLQPAGEEILEYICQENNIDLVHVNAPAQLP
jgi:hypothetical protein